MSDAQTSTTTTISASPVPNNEDIVLETRLYLGNVDFNVTQEELIEQFKDFKIEKVDIPKRTVSGGRKFALGFAFINLDDADKLDQFIEKYNKTSFKDRIITVRRATAPVAKEDKPKRTAVKNKKNSKAANKKEDVKNTSEETTTTADEKKKSEEKPSKKTSKKPQQAKPRIPLSEGTPSTTTVYITNIDFNLDTKKLSDYLKNETSYKPTWVHVPTQKIPSYLLRSLKKKDVPIRYKSRGFAFVRFNTEAEQLNFIEEFNGKKINDREITAKPAIDMPETEAKENEEETPEEK
ncbi:hypothetical protein DASC09_000150 [Saccharomycopsis crataegensis]|uniref:RRM domain-containing protein n=1 Tax=Saccharomycopsis crataegensis TaxID=43959 RepID=A0AAV5QE26_9ASCO|nr:hypothetical protein DASC09_000150 [Saccharomycopsis crataegensis]